MPLFNMTATALRNLFARPATRLYPAEKRELPAGTRGRLTIDIETCIFCGICQKKCPTDALRVERDAKRWSIDRLGCIACANCVDACPKDCLSMETGHSPAMLTRDKETHTPAAKPPAAPTQP
jgi:formate hydrogenlyase subunit 6/NADH:ubiquinone oxidoreductase subunit I